MRFVFFIGLALSIAADRGISQTTPPRYSITAAAGSAPPSGDNGPATAALLGSPQYIVVDGAGNIYFSEGLGYRIRKVTPDGTITTVAGTGAVEVSSDGSQASSSPIDNAEGVALDSQGNVLFADIFVRKILPSGIIMTVAGGTTTGFGGDGGPATRAVISGNSEGITFDQSGNLYIVDTGNNRVRKVDTNGIITTVAGTGVAGFSGDGGAATAAQLNTPSDVRADASGNLYIADRLNNRIRRISPSGIISTFAGTGAAGSAGDGGGATSAQLNSPTGLAIDASGRIYVSESGGNRIRRITQTLAVTSIETVAGTGTGGFAGDGALAISAQIDQPWGIALDSAGNLYIADGGVSQRIRKVSTSGIISTVAGASHFTGDGGAAVSALLNFPEAVAADSSGNLYIADRGNDRIRQVTPDGKIRTIAGNGTRSFSGDGGPATSASLNGPGGVAVDRGGNVYIADTGNARIRMINPAGVITTVAGAGTGGAVGDGGLATSANLNIPRRIAVDAAGNLYVADAGANRVRMVNTKGIISTIAGTGANGFSGDGGLATSAQLATPSGVAVDTVGNVFIADSNNERVRKVDGNGMITTVAGNGGGVSFSGDGGPATSAGIRNIPGVGVDSAGNIFLADPLNGRIRMVNSAGIISTVAGTGTRVNTGDGGLATSATIAADSGNGSLGFGFAVGQGGVIYFADTVGEEIRKLTPNIPSQLTIVSGNNQSGGVGAPLPNPLVVSVFDPSGVAVSGVSITFAVASGSGKLSAISTVTASNGLAGVALTLGNITGTTVVTASIAGSTLPSVQFTATALATCSVPQPVVTSVNSAGDFGGSATFAPGSWLEIKGSNLAQSTRQWAGGDFSGSNAPTSLDGVAVTVGGNQAFVAYISPSQINVQAPAGAATGAVPLTVTTASCSSAGFTVQEAALAPGLLAPSSFNIGGKQYLVALFPDGVTYVGNANLISGVPFRPAAPGDVLTAYGIGFGPVSPPISPGVIAGVANSLPNLTIGFGTAPATVLYAGLAPGTVGEYQFTFSVPNVANGDYPILFQLGSTQAPQTVYLTVHQ